jgi:predicted RecA/RadA family phage recombinase
MKNYVHRGRVLTLTAPRTVTSGQGALVGVIFGLATVDITSGDSGEFQVEGVCDVAKDASVFSQGERVYWDDSNHVATSTTSGDTLIGAAEVAAVTGAATVRVRLNAKFG